MTPVPSGREVHLYDTTLRDGMQGEGMSLSAEEKLRVAHAIDDLGWQFIEAGFPSSNPKEAELFRLIERETFRNAELVPVREVDDHVLGAGEPGEITRVVQQHFADALYGRRERYRGGLDAVAVSSPAA